MNLPIRRRLTRDRSDQLDYPRDESQPLLDPFAYIDHMHERMDALLRDLRAGTDWWSWSTPVDIEETRDAYVVEAELPGVAKDDLELEWDGRQLSIHGEVKERERVGFLRHKTRRTGRFDYTLTLPGEVDGDRIEASLSDGVLTIHAPKAASSHARRIPIAAGRHSDRPGLEESRSGAA